MKKTITFGKIAYQNKNVKNNLVSVDIEYTEKTPGQKVLSICGDIWNHKKTDIICGGQCLDEIAKYIKTPLFKDIYRLWKLYHLNDMHPECEHQAAAGWREKAKTAVNLYHWRMTREAINERDKAKAEAMKALKTGATFTPTKEQAFFASLDYSLETHTPELPQSIANYYEPKKPLYNGDSGHIETKTLGWLRESEHPDGILCKPCPVCGYKYGSSWNYFPIPAEDEAIIYKILDSEVF